MHDTVIVVFKLTKITEADQALRIHLLKNAYLTLDKVWATAGDDCASMALVVTRNHAKNKGKGHRE